MSSVEKHVTRTLLLLHSGINRYPHISWFVVIISLSNCTDQLRYASGWSFRQQTSLRRCSCRQCRCDWWSHHPGTWSPEWRGGMSCPCSRIPSHRCTVLWSSLYIHTNHNSVSQNCSNPLKLHNQVHSNDTDKWIYCAIFAFSFLFLVMGLRVLFRNLFSFYYLRSGCYSQFRTIHNQKAPQGGCGHRRQHARLR